MIKRPLGVTILAALAIICGIYSVYSLIFMILLPSTIFSLTLDFIATSSLIVVIVGIFCVLIVYGFLKGLRWSWFLAITLSALVIAIQVAEMFEVFPLIPSFPQLVTVKEILFIVICGIILFYLTRSNVKTYFGVAHLGDVTSVIKENRRLSAVISAGLIIGVSSWGFTPISNVEIIDVTHIPENPQPGDKITIIAEIAGVRPFSLISISCEYATYFGGTGSGGGTMFPMGNNKYSYTPGIQSRHPFGSGTEIWCMMRAWNIISEEHIIQVGHVERSNITSLSISDVVHIPEKPTTRTRVIQIKANITNNVSISSVTRSYMMFYPNGTRNGGGTMHLEEGDTYVGNISLSNHLLGEKNYLEEKEYYPTGTKVFYRIAAKDELGNTAVTSTHSFTLT